MSSLLGRGVVYATAVVVARTLGPAVYGLLALGVAVTHFSLALGRGGIDKGVVRYIAIFGGEGRYGRAKEVLLAGTLAGILISCIVALGQFLSARLLAEDFFGKPQSAPFIAALSFLVIARAVLAVLIAALRALRLSVPYAIVEHFVSPLAGLLGFCAASVFGIAQFGATWYRAAGAAIAVPVAVCFLLRERVLCRSGQTAVHLWQDLRMLLAFSLPLMFSDLGLRVIAAADVIMLGRYSLASQVGSYQAAIEMNTIALLGLGSVGMASAPMFSHLHNRRNRVELENVLARSTRWALSIASPALACCVLFPDVLLSIYGAGYAKAALPLAILAVGQLLHVATGPVGWLLSMSGRSLLTMANTWAVGLLNVILNLYLIPRMGMVGAALATATALAVMKVATVIQVRVLVEVGPFSYRSAVVAGIATVAYGGGWLVSRLFSLDSLFWKWVMIGSSTFIYAATVLLITTDRDDRNMLRTIARSLGFRGAARTQPPNHSG